jgi:hypothetical protein
MASNVPRQRRRSLFGVTSLERIALGLVGVENQAQLDRIDEARAHEAERILQFAESGQMTARDLATCVRTVEKRVGRPFREVLAGISSRGLASLRWGHTRSNERELEFDERCRTGAVRFLLHALPVTLRPTAARAVRSDGRTQVDALNELARAAGATYTGGRPRDPDKNPAAAEAAYNRFLDRDLSKTAAINAAAKAGKYSLKSRRYLLELAKAWGHCARGAPEKVVPQS